MAGDVTFSKNVRRIFRALERCHITPNKITDLLRWIVLGRHRSPLGTVLICLPLGRIHPVTPRLDPHRPV